MHDINIKRSFWSIPADKAMQFLRSSLGGLSNGEAKARLDFFGHNIFPRGRSVTKFGIFLGQFKNPLIIVLIVAGIATAFISEAVESIFIFIAVAVNTTLGFYQENKAENALSKLRSYIREVVRIVRGGEEMEIDAEEIVPGDMIRLFPGGRVPADARVIEANNLAVDESIITGESLPSPKSLEPCAEDAVPADRISMVMAGTLVVEGLGLAVVISTGGSTELGKIASLVGNAAPETTPLQIAILKFVRRITIVIGLFIAALFAYGVYAGKDIVDMFVISVAVAVSAVPEGLPVAMTVILSVGVLRLAKKRGVVRKLLAAETLGSTTLIMTDKTGTLTEAKMVLMDVLSDRDRRELLELALINTDVIIEKVSRDPKNWRLIGRPLETAIAASAIAHHVSPEAARKRFKVLDRRPFSSSEKFGATYVDDGKRKFWNYLGAPDVLVANSSLLPKDKAIVLQDIDRLAYAGNRVLAVAEDKKLLGLLAFRDPVRASVKDSIARIGEAGVKVVIITGDHQGTALSVANEVGIPATDDEILSGEELRKLSDDELKEKLGFVKIFARVVPEDKLRIARLYKGMGEVVAMTGDGVNDAPALKEADIGIAVGTGTDVAKSAADLVILDDNFETIVSAIEEGRRILDNIKKAIVYVFSSLLDEIILIAGSLVLSMPLPLSALQILWVNFFLDSFPAIALAFEDGIDHLKTKPSKLNGRLFDPVMKFLVIVVGVSSSLILLGLYRYLINAGFDSVLVRTFIFATFSLYTLFLIFSVRSLRVNLWRYNPFSNFYLVGAVVAGFMFTGLAVYFPPLQSVFGTVALPLPWVLGVVVFSLLNMMAAEAGKFFFGKR
ncbi:MAG: hypothetical protein A3B23_00030 [Candidatus Colwellbacteria bacterium RIFCSPLOWO2_01_FULL_48_10]|uniref:Cation-transporting P-type ATPase N-terminal domain-containing protein n=2 Tax=Bacteria candidate phyla TaxID=1783234 RepID=A0A1G1Z5G7_9BACT|nr:MAG: hypothetical protein A3B23_00030 [Candidatus Colwellbacteria bacterium RIFCSPLOWO2_01_FULL_48_10]